MIQELQNLCLKLNLITARDIECYSTTQLLYIMIEKINEIIKTVNQLAPNMQQIIINQLHQWLEDGTLDEIINTTVFEELRNKIEDDVTYVRPEWYKASDDLDDTSSLRIALMTGKATKLSSKEYFISDTLYIKTNGTLIGNGKTTRIVLTPAFKGTKGISLENEQTKNVTLKDFYLYGDIKNQVKTINGIDLTSSFENRDDMRHIVENVIVEAVSGDGVVVVGRGGNVLNNVHVLWCGGHAFNLNMWDSTLINCDGGSTEGHVFYIRGASCRFINCKGWWAGDCGYFVKGSRHHFVGCESQDTYNEGFRLEGANTCMLDSVLIDGAGEKGTTKYHAEGYPAITLKDTSFTTLSGVVEDRKEYYNTTTISYALNIEGYCTALTGRLQAVHVKLGLKTGDGTINRRSHMEIEGQLESDGTRLYWSSDIMESTLTADNECTLSKNTVIRRDGLITINLDATLSPMFADGSAVCHNIQTHFKPRFNCDLICQCVDNDGSLLGYATLNCTGSGYYNLWNAPSGTSRIKCHYTFQGGDD